MRATPTEVKLILIDPKRVEMAQYKGIPHLLTEVIVDTDKAVNALKWTVGTMESRYHEFAQRGVRNIAGYNDALKPGEPRMPYIVIVIDELADLMMVSAYEVEATITRIAQLARATGIHLVVATQRPSVQVITGLIKANIPSPHRLRHDQRRRQPHDPRHDRRRGPAGPRRHALPADRRAARGAPAGRARHRLRDRRRWRATGAARARPQYRPEITAPKRDGKARRTARRRRG